LIFFTNTSSLKKFFFFFFFFFFKPNEGVKNQWQGKGKFLQNFHFCLFFFFFFQRISPSLHQHTFMVVLLFVLVLSLAEGVALQGKFSSLKAERCVNKASPLWEGAKSVVLSPVTAQPGDRVQLIKVANGMARITIESFFPQSVWIEVGALGVCPKAPVPLWKKIRSARSDLKALRRTAAACLTDECFEVANNNLLRGMRRFRSLCSRDQVCTAKQEALRLLQTMNKT
jgi:hypothetical protein